METWCGVVGCVILLHVYSNVARCLITFTLLLCSCSASSQLHARLGRALVKGEIDKLDSALVDGADPDTWFAEQKYKRTKLKGTALQIALINSNTDASVRVAQLQALLAAGANPDPAPGHGCYAPLRLALSRGDDASSLALLDAGADPNMGDCEDSDVLHIALEGVLDERLDHQVLVRVLEAGADPRPATWSPFGEVFEHREEEGRDGVSEEVISVLAEHGADYRMLRYWRERELLADQRASALAFFDDTAPFVLGCFHPSQKFVETSKVDILELAEDHVDLDGLIEMRSPISGSHYLMHVGLRVHYEDQSMRVVVIKENTQFGYEKKCRLLKRTPIASLSDSASDSQRRLWKKFVVGASATAAVIIVMTNKQARQRVAQCTGELLRDQAIDATARALLDDEASQKLLAFGLETVVNDHESLGKQALDAVLMAWIEGKDPRLARAVEAAKMTYCLVK